MLIDLLKKRLSTLACSNSTITSHSHNNPNTTTASSSSYSYSSSSPSPFISCLLPPILPPTDATVVVRSPNTIQLMTSSSTSQVSPPSNSHSNNFSQTNTNNTATTPLTMNRSPSRVVSHIHSILRAAAVGPPIKKPASVVLHHGVIFVDFAELDNPSRTLGSSSSSSSTTTTSTALPSSYSVAAKITNGLYLTADSLVYISGKKQQTLVVSGVTAQERPLNNSQDPPTKWNISYSHHKRPAVSLVLYITFTDPAVLDRWRAAIQQQIHHIVHFSTNLTFDTEQVVGDDTNIASSLISTISESSNDLPTTTCPIPATATQHAKLMSSLLSPTLQLPHAPHSTSVHDFHMLTPLGKGAFAKVFLVRHKLTNRLYAMKVIDKPSPVHGKLHETATGKMWRLIAEERKVLAMVKGAPFILQLRYAFQSANKFYLVTDYCEGGNLLQAVKTMSHLITDPERLKIILAEILIALLFLHNNGIMYRDLKLENVLLTGDGHVRLADFGLAKVDPSQSFSYQQSVGSNLNHPNENLTCFLSLLSSISSSSTSSSCSSSSATAPSSPSHNHNAHQRFRANSFCGTRVFMSPEMVQRHSYSIATDIWSFGIVAYSLFYGKAPFAVKKTGAGGDDLLRKIQQAQITYPASNIWSNPVAEGAIDLLKDVLVRDELDRLSVSEIMEHPFFQGINWTHLATHHGSTDSSSSVSNMSTIALSASSDEQIIAHAKQMVNANNIQGLVFDTKDVYHSYHKGVSMMPGFEYH